MILAGVLLKMGGYGIIRVCYPICPSGGYDLAYFVCTIGVLSMVYGAFAAMAQKDFNDWSPTVPSATWATSRWVWAFGVR